MPAQITGIVVRDRAPGDLPVGGRDRSQLAFANQPVEQLRVMDHFELEAELPVLVLECVEAVRAAGDDAYRLGLPEHFDVLQRQLLVKELVARAPGGITGTGLPIAEHRERDARGVQ